jgi:sugar lactone lactonase YvrE
MLFTVTAEPTPVDGPPRMRLDLDTQDSMSTFTSITVRRDDVLIRAVAPVGSSVSVVYDYDAPYDTDVTYTVEAQVVTVTPGFTEDWTNLLSWTATVAGWSVSSGKATSSTDGAMITRTVSGTLGSLDSLDVDWTTVKVLDAADVVLAQVEVIGDHLVLTGNGEPVTSAGSGAFSLVFSGGTVNLSGVGYAAIGTTYNGVPTKVSLVAALGDPLQLLTFPTLVSAGPGATELSSPSNVAVDSAGTIWAVDTSSSRILKYSAAGVYQGSFGSYGTGNGQFRSPWGIAIDGSDVMWVTDGQNHRVQKFTPSGGSYVYASKFGSATPAPSTANGEFNTPLDICIDSGGNLWVVDFYNNRIQKFNSAGVYQSKFGSFGIADGQFRYAAGITRDSSNNLYVVEYGAEDLAGGHRVQKFNSSGVFQTKWGHKGIGESQFKSPVGIHADSANNILVADYGNNRIQKFTNAGVLLYIWDGSIMGGTKLSGPRGVFTDSTDKVFVAESLGQRIRKFESTQQAAVVDDVTVTLAPPSPTSVVGTDTETLAGEAAWLIHSTTPGLSIKFDNGPDGDRGDLHATLLTSQEFTVPASGRTVLEIEGSDTPVVVTTGPRRKPDRILQLSAVDFATRDKVLALFQSNDPVLVRSPQAWGVDMPEGWFSPGPIEPVERTTAPLVSQRNKMTTQLTPIRTPVIETSFGRTYAGDVIAGGTYGDAVNSGRTYLERLTG